MLVFDRLGHLRRQVLDQRAATRDVERLHPEADAKYGYLAPFGHFEKDQVGLVSLRRHRPELLMRLLAVIDWIEVAVAARQHQAVEPLAERR